MSALGPAVTRNSPRTHAILSFVYIAARIVALCMSASAQENGAQSVVLSGSQSAKHPLHVVAKSTRRANQLPANAAASAPFCVNSLGNPGTCSFNYYGGPVISNPDVVVVYWKSTVSSVVNCGGGKDSGGNCIGVSRFLGDLADSTYVDMLQQYNTAGLTATAGSQKGVATTNQTIGRGTLHTGSPFVITPHAANSGSPINDTQIQNEIQLQIAAGTLPAPETDSTGNVNTLYFVYFPPNLVISDSSVGTSCAAGGFCAYHSTLSLNAKDVPYGVVPDFGPGSGCDIGCGSGTEWQNITSASSHEYAESTTDTAVGLATVFGPPLSWYDANNGEIGDPCNQHTDTLQFDSVTYTFQQEFSQKSYNANHNAGCVSPGTLTFTLTAPASGPAGVPFDVTVKVTNSDGSTYLGAVHFTSSDSTATLPGDYTFTIADAGTHKFSSGVTLGTSGNQTITASDAHQSSTAGTATFSVGGKAATTTTLKSSVQPSTYRQAVTFTAIVTATSGSPTGLVTFKDGASTIGTGTVSGGLASLMVSSLTIGTHSITALYGGDTNFNGSSSSVLSQVVNRASTTTALTSSPNPSIVNQQVTFTATVSGHNGGTPTGSITFKQGTTTVATKSLVSGSASFATTYTTSGSRSLSATYSGDGNFLASTSSHIQSVLKASTTTTLSSSHNPSSFGNTVTFTSTVSSAAGTPANGDTVKFIDGITTIGTGTLTAGVASFTTTALTAGTHKIKASFVTDSSYGGSSSAVLSQVVNGLPTTSTVSSNLNPSIYGQAIIFSATVVDNAHSGIPTGTVTFKAGTAILGKVPLSSGKASFSISTIGVGTKSITVTYSGDTKYAASTSAAISQIINKATSAASITSSLNPSTSGQSVTFTISVAPQFTGVPTGAVSLTLGSTVLAILTLANGTTSYTTTTLPSGSDVIKASYSGSGNFKGSSGSIPQTVN
jgi:Bacterial Ig-like domain (group 3)